MTLRTRLAVVAGLVLVVLLAVGVLLPRIVRSSLVDQVDHQLDAAVPIALDLSQNLGTSAANRHPPAATRLSELYVARESAGSRQLVVAPASLPGREPKLPATSCRPISAPCSWLPCALRPERRRGVPAESARSGASGTRAERKTDCPGTCGRD